MKAFFRLLIFISALAVFFASSLVSYSADKGCPEQNQQPIGEDAFLSAHGITHENFSIWLREHSAWHRQYSTELKTFTFIPDKGYDTRRK